MNLKYEAIGTVQTELTIMKMFSEYLKKEYPQIKNCSDLDREVLEEFLIHLSTKESSHSANNSYVLALRRQLETIGKIYSYERLEHLFINTDIPPPSYQVPFLPSMPFLLYSFGTEGRAFLLFHDKSPIDIQAKQAYN